MVTAHATCGIGWSSDKTGGGPIVPHVRRIRIIDGDGDRIPIADMGAYEFGDVCECDLNHDGRCDMSDWLLFGEDWRRTDCHDPGVQCECDLNHDGRCDVVW